MYLLSRVISGKERASTSFESPNSTQTGYPVVPLVERSFLVVRGHQPVSTPLIPVKPDIRLYPLLRGTYRGGGLAAMGLGQWKTVIKGTLPSDPTQSYTPLVKPSYPIPIRCVWGHNRTQPGQTHIFDLRPLRVWKGWFLVPSP